VFEAAAKAFSQMLSPPMRRILWRSIALALGLLAVVAVGLQRLLSWFTISGEQWAGTLLGPTYSTAIDSLAWILSIAAALGIVIGAVFLMPAVTALVASIFVDEVAEEVERTHYPAERSGVALPLSRALIEGIKTALLAVLLYLVALPFFFFAGLGVIIFFFVAAYLLGREYFLLAAMRFRSIEEAKAFRKEHASTVFAAGCVVAAFVSIPIVNLATPLFGTAFMVHMHKRLSGPRPELLEPVKPPPAAA
jgi:CysZ protein